MTGLLEPGRKEPRWKGHQAKALPGVLLREVQGFGPCGHSEIVPRTPVKQAVCTGVWSSVRKPAVQCHDHTEKNPSQGSTVPCSDDCGSVVIIVREDYRKLG